MNWTCIGSMIKEERKKKGLTQKELARKAGLSRQTLSKIESGHAALVSLVVFEKLLRILDLEIELKPRKKKRPGELWTPEELME